MKKLKTHELNRLSPEEFRGAPKLPITLVLDNVRSGLNVGSVFRTCDALAIEEVILTGITPVPPHKEINKTALGSTASVNWSYESSAVALLNRLRKMKYKIVLVEQTDESIPLQSFKADAAKRYALVFGNEVDGISEELISLADSSVEIPQFGTKHSFNIAVSAGIVLWEFTRQMKRIESSI